MATWITPKEGAFRFRNLAKEIEREQINGIRRATHAWRKKAFGLFSQRGIGKVFGERTAVLGRKPRGANTKQARVIIKRERVVSKGNGIYETGLLLKGFAALVEAGGRTKPHEIKAAEGGVLAWQGPSGTLFARRVKHPGSQIPRNPFVEDAGRQSEGEFKRQMEIAAQRAIALAKLAEAA